MKRFFAFLICAVMILSAFSALTLTSSADEGEIDPMEWINEYIQTVNGDWYVRRMTDFIGKDEDYTPAGGYYYDGEGFHTVSPDYTNMTPSYAVVSKEKFNLQAGFSMTFRVDEFDYKGENGNGDEWMSVCISDSPFMFPADTTHGRGTGWTPLIRGDGSGTAVCESYWTGEKNADGTGGMFTAHGTTSINCEMSDGKELYTLDVTYDGSDYGISMNGVSIPGNKAVSDKLNDLNGDGDFYISIVVYSTVVASPFAISILNVNDSVPTGNDNVPAEENDQVFGEMIDPSTVPTNQPALLYDANKATFKKDPDMQNCEVVPNGDGSYTITSTVPTSFLTWTVNKPLTYNAEDFPVFCILAKNMAGSTGGMFVLSGDNLGPAPSCRIEWDVYDYDFAKYTREWRDADGAYWNLIVIDLNSDDITVENTGRIHGCRIDFNGLDTTGEEPFDLMYMAYFRSEDECQAYAEAYLTRAGVITGDETEETPTDGAETEPATDEIGTEAPATDTATETAAEVETGADATNAATAAAEEEGCSSVIGAGAAALVLSAMAAAVALRKKH